MHAAMSGFLKDATGILCSFLKGLLPSFSEHWWDKNVLRNLTFQQQQIVRDKKINSLSRLDLSSLLRILDKNWYQIAQRKCISSDARLYIKEMNAVRNRWAHAGAEETPTDDVYRDLDTLLRFASAIEAGREFTDRVKIAKEKVLLKPLAPDLPAPEPRLARKIISRTTKPTKPTVTPPGINTKRRQRDPKLEAALKDSLCQLLKNQLNESFVSKGDSQFVFSPSGRRYLCKYSSFKRDQSRWFWGVSEKYWGNWGDKDHLALILENEADQGYSYLLLDSLLSKKLLNKCSESNREKKINMRIYMTHREEIRLQEWQELSIKDRIKPLPLG
jgi:hypothetical protein